MAVWYVRDNSTVNSGYVSTFVPGSIGWSGVTAWSGSASIAPGTIRRPTASPVVFTGSQTTTTLTVTAITSGALYLGQTVLTPSQASSPTITALGTGTGGTGTYTLSVSQSIGSGTWNGGILYANPRAFIAVQTTTGTTAATEPKWILTKGAKTTDNTVTWMECTGQAAVNGDLTNTQNWTAVRNTALALGRIITDNAGTHIFIVTTAGTTNNVAEPTWTTTSAGNTTADGGVTWTYIGASFSTWSAPFSYFNNCFGSNWAAAGDTIYLGDDHSEIQQSFSLANVTFGTNGTSAAPFSSYSIDHTLSLPVTAPKSGATIATGNANALGLAASEFSYWNGITFSAATGNNNDTLTVGGSTWAKFENCNLKVASTHVTPALTFNGPGVIELVNTTLQLGSTSQTLKLTGGVELIWRNTASATLGSVPTTLFNAANAGSAVFEAVDLSALGSGKTIMPAGTAVSDCIEVTLIDCKLGASVTVAATPGDRTGPFTDVIRCSSDSKTYVQRRYWYSGTLQEEATIIRTNGASDGTTGISWNITTTANAKWIDPFESFPIAIWNSVVSPTDRTITLHGIWNSASLPNNDDIWIDVAYFGDSGSPQASFATETKSSGLASNTPLTADSSSAWDSVATARAQNHAYSQGDVISASTNVGRIFFCTGAGTSANTSIPAGYASAVDGGNVTDGGATFRAGTRFTLSVGPLSPKAQLVGYLRAYIKAAKATSTFYVDPLVTLS